MSAAMMGAIGRFPPPVPPPRKTPIQMAHPKRQARSDEAIRGSGTCGRGVSVPCGHLTQPLHWLPAGAAEPSAILRAARASMPRTTQGWIRRTSAE